MRGLRDGAGVRRIDQEGRAAQVEHGDLVAETVQLEKTMVREGIHGNLYGPDPRGSREAMPGRDAGHRAAR
jgi:hypothetical protein